jgi:2-dehydro-3-deoxygluconokinase
MLRLDPGDHRIHATREFRVWESGGEYDVAGPLRCGVGLKTAVVSDFADNLVDGATESSIVNG